MPIKILIPKEAILHRIWTLRPLLNIKQDMNYTGDVNEAVQDGSVSLGLAHRIYTLGLDSLIAARGTRCSEFKTVGLRVYEMSKDKPQAYFDVSEEEEPRLLQMSASESQLKLFTQGLELALKTVEQIDQEAELRLFQVPALNFEALWINYEGETKDLLVPLRTVGQLNAYEVIPWDEALDALRDAARPLANMDDTMGA